MTQAVHSNVEMENTIWTSPLSAVKTAPTLPFYGNADRIGNHDATRFGQRRRTSVVTV